MRVLVILLVYIIVQVNGDCLEIEQCVQNVTKTFLTFGEHYSHIMFRARDYIKDLIPKFTIYYRDFNATVLSGPKSCQKKHLLNKKMGYYFRDAMNLCLVPEPDPNPEDIENIKDTNENVFKTDDRSNKVRYCEHLVSYFNIYCKYLDDVMETADNCDVLKNFDELFKSKWAECNEKAGRFKDRLARGLVQFSDKILKGKIRNATSI